MTSPSVYLTENDSATTNTSSVSSLASSQLVIYLVISTVWLLLAPAAIGQTETVLYSFKGGPSDGFGPYAGVSMDSHGNLYGTTMNGGTHGINGYPGGVVYRLTPSGARWIESVLYNFGDSLDGYEPWSGVIMNTNGKLYGTTRLGGALGFGTFYEITPGALHAETGIYSFNYGPVGAYPVDLGSLIEDTSGNFYGTTNGGGGYGGGGNVFQMTISNGLAVENVLHTFVGGANDGLNPNDGLVTDAEGDLFGTTIAGGPGRVCSVEGCGTIFELSPNGDGTYREGVIYGFTGLGDGSYPQGGLAQDIQGHLYGTTTGGGTYGLGTVFELQYQGNGVWAEGALHSFGSPGDGNTPWSKLVIDSHGHLFGTTTSGGAYGGGTVFELSRNGGFNWQETILHSFNSSPDVYEPIGGLIMDLNGVLYSTAYYGGANGGGGVFKIVP